MGAEEGLIASFWMIYCSEELLEVNYISTLYEMHEMPRIV